MTTYELEPKYDNAKSFYGKATVTELDALNSILLRSYNTKVAKIKDNKAIVYGTYSMTTLRHIKEFLRQNGFEVISKKQIEEEYMR